MTQTERKQLKRLISLLNKAQEIADRLELLNGSGGELGSLIGSIADELEVKYEHHQ